MVRSVRDVRAQLALMHSYGAFVTMPFFMILAGVSAPDTHGADTTCLLFVYLVLSAYLLLANLQRCISKVSLVARCASKDSLSSN